MTETAFPTKILSAVSVVIVISAMSGWALWDVTRERLILATTTSTYDTGLLGYLVPIFESKHHFHVDVISLGTGQALNTARMGDADVVLVHSRAAEEAFVSDGYGIHRVGVMYNDFIVLGPPSDPAGVEGMTDVVSAFKKIHAVGLQGKALFISRDDNSGTHLREKDIWSAASLSPSGSWYVPAGQGMSETLTMAGEKRAYTLSDRGSWLSYKANLNLQVVVEGDRLLINPYAAILVNPEMNPKVRCKAAITFVKFLVSPEGQDAIRRFERGGTSLFIPLARDYPRAVELGFPNQQQEVEWYDDQ